MHCSGCSALHGVNPNFFLFKLDWGFYIISIAKIGSKKIGTLICSMRFFSLEYHLYLYKSSIRPCMVYSCHVWAGVPSCYLELLDKLQKQICFTCCVSWTLGLLSNCGQLKSFLKVLLWQMFFRTGSTGSTCYSRGRSTRDSDRLHGFSVTIPRCCKGVYVTSFFPCTARLWNSVPIESFPLTHDVSGSKSRINRHRLTEGYF